LELTNNSKVGWAFSLPRKKTCINATDICKKLCYGNGIRYQSDAQKTKRERNYRTVELLLARGGTEQLANNLIHLIDTARPRDWLAAKLMNTKPEIPWTLRIHDVGDFHSQKYARAWWLAVKLRPECQFWFYTRSFQTPEVFEELSNLASLPNCQGWLSVDSENFSQALLAKCNDRNAGWKLAILQHKDMELETIEAVTAVTQQSEVINFPYHHGGKHLLPMYQNLVLTCPAILGKYELQNRSDMVRPCQQCKFCLP
jgi:hypothetical protein